MENLKKYLFNIEAHLIQTHSKLFDWFNCDDKLKLYCPANGGWCISQVLEHVMLTSHFLLILIDKGRIKALKNVNAWSLEDELNSFHFDLEKLDEIGVHKSFSWTRPEHMEPKGEKAEIDIKLELIHQLTRCLTYLEELKNGEGLLNKTTMTVNELGKINVYEYIYFLSKHAERHLCQIEKVKEEYDSNR
ncbi:MAG: DinB family protein [Bacteroidia bacterium]